MVVKDNEEFLISNNRLTGDALSVSSFIVGSIIQNQRFKYDDGMNRRVDYGFYDEYRKAKMVVEAKTKYGYDIATLRDAINELFYGTYYIREMRLTYDNDKPVKYESIGKTTGDMNLGEPRLVGGKQLKVRNVSEIVQSVDDLWFEFEVKFETVELPYWETSYTTQQLNKTQYDAFVEKYGWADNLNVDYLNYTFTTSDFTVFNAGNIDLDPRYTDTTITFFGVNSTNNFTVENLTTGDKFVAQRALNNVSVTLKNATFLMNLLNRHRESNRGIITFAKGVNRLKVTNGTFNKVEIDTKFYYK